MPEVHESDGERRNGDPDAGTVAATFIDEFETGERRPSDVLTLREVAAWMRVNAFTVYGLAQRGEIPFFRAGRNFRFRWDDLQEWSRTHRPSYKRGPQKKRRRAAG